MTPNCTHNFRFYENGNITVTANINRTGRDHDSYVSAGKTQKKYSINSDQYRKLQCASINLFRQRINRVIFLTLTFPGQISEREANICLSRFLDNLSTNYKLNNYVAVKELTKAGTPHFHILADIPYKNIRAVNKAWCNSYRNYFGFSPNAVRLPVGRGRAIVKDMERAVKYISKYVSKARFSKDSARTPIEYLARCIFISHGIISKPIDADIELAEKLSKIFQKYEIDFMYCHIIYLKLSGELYDSYWKIVTEFT